MSATSADEERRVGAVTGLSRTYLILESETVRAYAARYLVARRTEEDAKVHDLKLSDAERRDALIRWTLLGELLSGPTKDMIMFHTVLGTQPEKMLDLNESGTDART